jgi:hypothetical protein
MEKAVSGNITGYIDRRLHGVRLGLSHLNKMLEGTRSGSTVSINRDLLVSISSTIEIFIEDFEVSCLGASPAQEGKDAKSADSPRVTQTRVS